METEKGTLRIWWSSNPPKEAFNREVKTTEEAKHIIDVLTQYDLYLGDLINSNACGLEVFNGSEWEEWENEDGEDINA